MLKSKDRPMPAPTYMSDDQKAEYLRSLRSSTFTRPSGSRPAPPSRYTSTRRSDTEFNTGRDAQDTRIPALPPSKSMPSMPAQTPSHSRSSSSTSAKLPPATHPVVPKPSISSLRPTHPPTEGDIPSLTRQPSIPYLERGTRWMEKQEVASIRQALHDMDVETEEEQRRIHAAAQDEAAELVYRHQNPEAADAPYANRDLQRDYHSHLRKGSYTRSHTQEVQRKVSGGSHESSSSESSITSNKRLSIGALRKVSPPAAAEVTVQKRRVSSNGKPYGALAEAVADDIAKAHRRSSSGSHRIMSGEKKRAFMHPDDRIWEDPQEERLAQSNLSMQKKVVSPQYTPVFTPPAPTIQQPQQPQAVQHIRKNPFARVRMQTDKLERSRSEPIIPTATPIPETPSPNHRVEIHRNPPSQSRRPWYTSNISLPPTPPATSNSAVAEDEVSPKVTPTREGKEIRGDDIRAATSKKRNDYSPKLPRPTMVSDKPGRPIVSFDQGWKPKEVVLERVESQAATIAGAGDGFREPVKTRQLGAETSNIPRISVDTASDVPTFNLPVEGSIPTIVLPDDPADFAEPMLSHSPGIAISPPEINIEPPTIQIDDSSTMPMPTKIRAAGAAPSPRPLPTHAASSPLPMSRPHYTPTIHQSSTLCAHCALPIAGRILSASGARFHPACFTCHACHTNLELVAFYAEPEKARSERLSRIQSRLANHAIPGEETLTPSQRAQREFSDGEAHSPRFYCHLDYHEHFSPRCKSCKTPIEGEVILACGAEWHAGHFFCAQCGDPFDSATPFVEKDGYAWCVGCHTNRFSAKCRRCRKPVTDMVVKALGAEWHQDCFVCQECGGQFKDGRYFLRGVSQDPVCVGCEERRLKS